MFLGRAYLGWGDSTVSLREGCSTESDQVGVQAKSPARHRERERERKIERMGEEQVKTNTPPKKENKRKSEE